MTSTGRSAPIVTDASLAANVERGHKLGWSFTPLRGKVPTLKGWQDRPREDLPEALGWAARGNVGLRTGRSSGIVVIDVDPGADVSQLDLPRTVTVNTGREGGRHYYFRCDGPLGNSSGKLGRHIDVKADGGQVVFPGSTHPETHRRYEWAEGLAPWEITIADLPADVLSRLRGDDRRVSPSSAAVTPPRPVGVSPYAAAALERELRAVCAAKEGTRNATLNAAAFSIGTLVGAGLLDDESVQQQLCQAGESTGLGIAEVAKTIRSGLNAGIKQPRQIPQPTSKRGSATDGLTAGYDLYGNADRFVRSYGQDVHWCQERGQWYVWDGKAWGPDTLRKAHGFAEQTMRALLDEIPHISQDKTITWIIRCNRDGKAAQEMLEVVKHRRAILLDRFDSDPWLLGVDNGVVDLKKGELLAHDRNCLISKLCPTRYDAQAPCERWERFLAEIMAGDEEMVASLQRMAGYFLTGDISVQVLPIFYGPGGNGKNVFLDTLLGVLGPHAAEAPEGLITARSTDEHPTEIADLCGKRLVVASETEEGRRMRIGLVKKLTGNRYLKGRFMRQDYFQFRRTHKTVLVTNNRPVITETSNAIWRRLRLIPFAVTIPPDKQDKHLTDKLVAEWPGILAWAVKGCLDWQRRQCDLAPPQTVTAATEEYRSDSDPVGQFIEERCLVMAEVKVSRAGLYQAYEQWARSSGEMIIDGKAFAGRMRAQGFDASLWNCLICRRWPSTYQRWASRTVNWRSTSRKA